MAISASSHDAGAVARAQRHAVHRRPRPSPAPDRPRGRAPSACVSVWPAFSVAAITAPSTLSGSAPLPASPGAAGGQHLEPRLARRLGEGLRAPVRLRAAAVGHDPDLEERRRLGLQVVLGVHHAGAGAHDLHVAGLGAALVAHVVAVGDRALADIGDDLHVAVRVRVEAGAGGDLVVVPDAQPAPAHARAGRGSWRRRSGASR